MSEPGIAALSLTWRDLPSAARAPLADPLPPELLSQLRAQGLSGLVAVHTCARSLWLISGPHPSWLGALFQAAVARRLPDRRPLPVLQGADALQFTLRVAVGLDSYLQGEADIGRQVLAAFAEARRTEQTDGGLNLLEQSVHRLIARARALGCVRPNRGLGALAVAELDRQRLPTDAPVAVVGMGAIGRRVLASLQRARRPARCFNRRPLPDTLPLSDLSGEAGDLPAAVLCTAAPAPWYAPRPGQRVIDLGLPGQCLPRPDRHLTTPLDALLSGDGLQLSPDRLALSEQLVQEEVELLQIRLRAAGWQHALSELNALRDAFLTETLPILLRDPLQHLPEEERRRTTAAVERAFRQFSHAILIHLKERGLPS